MIYRFMDMHSGGRCKEPPYQYIYIEASSEEEAITIFYNKFGHNPNRVTCTCCGSDYSIDEYKDMERASAYDRECKWNDKLDEPRGYDITTAKISLEDYLNRDDVLLILSSDISDEERCGNVPEEGYIWH